MNKKMGRLSGVCALAFFATLAGASTTVPQAENDYQLTYRVDSCNLSEASNQYSGILSVIEQQGRLRITYQTNGKAPKTAFSEEGTNAFTSDQDLVFDGHRSISIIGKGRQAVLSDGLTATPLGFELPFNFACHQTYGDADVSPSVAKECSVRHVSPPNAQVFLQSLGGQDSWTTALLDLPKPGKGQLILGDPYAPGETVAFSEPVKVGQMFVPKRIVVLGYTRSKDAQGRWQSKPSERETFSLIAAECPSSEKVPESVALVAKDGMPVQYDAAKGNAAIIYYQSSGPFDAQLEHSMQTLKQASLIPPPSGSAGGNNSLLYLSVLFGGIAIVLSARRRATT